MRHSFFLLGALVLAALVAGPALADDAPTGKELFVANKCGICHSIESQELESKMNKGGDLSDVGNEHDAEWMTQFLKKEADIDGAKHKASWKGSDEELKTLVDWLASLKKDDAG